MSFAVSIPQTILSYSVEDAETADVHRRVLKGLWLALSVRKIAELTGLPRHVVDRVRERARRELGKAGLAVPAWLSPPAVDKVR